MASKWGRLFAVCALCLVTTSGCRSVAPARANAELASALQRLLDDFVATNREVPAISLAVEMPASGFSWAGAAGLADRERGIRMDPRHPVRLASNTKTFVAVAILRLWETGLLELDQPIATHLSPESNSTLREGGYRPETITIRHLLTHTSGIFDFAVAQECNDIIDANPRHRWTREEQLRGAMTWGKPYGPPGRVYAYSDTGYILLGEILERKTGTSMAAALRHWVDYRRLGLYSTWLEDVEKPPRQALDRAHQYWNKRDTYTDDPSLDLFGGGGLVANVGDMARFFQGLFAGRIYRQPGTLDTMLTTVPDAIGGPPTYGSEQVPGVCRMGVFVRQMDGLTLYTHEGFWGTAAAYLPDWKASLALSATEQAVWKTGGLPLKPVLRLMHDRAVAKPKSL